MRRRGEQVEQKRNITLQTRMGSLRKALRNRYTPSSDYFRPILNLFMLVLLIYKLI